MAVLVKKRSNSEGKKSAVLLRLSQIIPDLLPIGKSTLWEWIAKGIFPKPRKIGPRVSVWDAQEVFDFIEHFQQTGVR